LRNGLGFSPPLLGLHQLGPESLDFGFSFFGPRLYSFSPGLGFFRAGFRTRLRPCRRARLWGLNWYRRLQFSQAILFQFPESLLGQQPLLQLLFQPALSLLTLLFRLLRSGLRGASQGGQFLPPSFRFRRNVIEVVSDWFAWLSG
jgi:hypothetical protein